MPFSPKVTPYTRFTGFEGEALSPGHAAVIGAALIPGSVVIQYDVPGKLRLGDAAAIYEGAFMSSGTVLDIGTNRGLSSAIMARAVADRGSGHSVITIDLDPRMTAAAKFNHEKAGISGIQYIVSDAGAWVKQYRDQGHKVGFVFVDHSHYYEPVASVCEGLNGLMLPGSFVAFHDYTDGRNVSPTSDFRVVDAADAVLVPPQFEFVGYSGCMGIYRFNG